MAKKKAKAAKAPSAPKPSKAAINTWITKLATANVTASAAGTKKVSFASDNANVMVQITAGGQSGVAPCKLNLPIGVLHLTFQSKGVGAFNVTAVGGDVIPPIAGQAPDSGARLISVQ